MRARKLSAGALALSLVLVAGCGGAAAGGAFSHTFPDDRRDHLEAVLARIASAGPRRDRAVAVGVTPSPVHLFAYDLAAGRVLFDVAAEPTNAPHVAGEHVISQEGEEIVVRALDDGRVLTRLGADHQSLVGADGEGELSVLVTSTGGAVGARSRVIALSGAGVAWQHALDQPFGEPAVRAGMVFVPWGHQNLSILDGATGDEIARVRVTTGVIGHAVATDDRVYFGQAGVGVLAPTTGSHEASPWFEPLERPMPSEVEMWLDAYRPPPSVTGAQHRVRLVWRGSGSGESVGLLDDTLYLVFYRLVFALEASRDAVRWVAQLPHDVVGATVEHGGVMLTDAEGGLHLLGRDDGRTLWTGSMGRAASYVQLQPGDFAPPGEASGELLPLRDQLLSAAQNTDARLVPARIFAVHRLGAVSDPDVTQNLIALCDDRGLPGTVRAAACETLGNRTEGASHVLAALDRHSAFLAGTTAPPVGALATAAARMHERGAAAALIAHLRDPETPLADLAPLLHALRELGAQSAVEPIRDFLRLYHAEPPEPGMAAALGAAAQALVALEGPSARETLTELIDDGLTMPALRDASRQAIATIDSAGSGGTETATAASETEGEMTLTEEDDPRPQRITQDILDQVLSPVDEELERCLVQPGRVHGQGRAVIVVMPEGSVAMVSVTPREIQACVEPIIRAQSFPATQARGRQQVTHVITR